MMAKVQKEGRRVPHELFDKNQRRGTALNLFSKFRKKNVMHKIIRSDEKWILYYNAKRRKSWFHLTLVNLRHRRQSQISTPRRFWSVSGGFGKICCITSCCKPGETIMTDHYQQQLINLCDALEEKELLFGQEHRKVILLHYNARPHVAKATQDHIFVLGWNFSRTQRVAQIWRLFDYYLFRSLQYHLADMTFCEI